MTIDSGEVAAKTCPEWRCYPHDLQSKAHSLSQADALVLSDWFNSFVGHVFVTAERHGRAELLREEREPPGEEWWEHRELDRSDGQILFGGESMVVNIDNCFAERLVERMNAQLRFLRIENPRMAALERICAAVPEGMDAWCFYCHAWVRSVPQGDWNPTCPDCDREEVFGSEELGEIIVWVKSVVGAIDDVAKTEEG